MRHRVAAFVLVGMTLLGPPSSAHAFRHYRHLVRRSAVVRDAQRELNDRGYDAGPPDGVPGPRTRRALARFQRDNGMRPTGRFDRRTMAALETRR